MDQITLITGTSRGIGKFLAQHYLDLGHTVIGCSRKESDWVHDKYHHKVLDVASEQSVKTLFADVRREYGKLDHLVNNAGIASMNHSLLTPAASVERVLATNVIGSFLCCREAAKLMQKNRFGRIVNFSSVAVPLKLEGESIYAASKAAIVSLSQILAREYAPFGITVNAVGPAPVKTDLIRGVSEEKIEVLLERQAVHRYCSFEDVANVVDFFLKPESGFVTGQILYLGGV